jgi:hypothetical protein
MAARDDEVGGAAGGEAAGGEEDLEGAAPAGDDDASPPVEEELDEGGDELGDDDDAAAAADAAAGGDGHKPPAPARQPVARHVPLNPQAREGLIRCLKARLVQLDANLAHATEVAGRDTFYSRWPGVVAELRAQALKRLEELQRS